MDRRIDSCEHEWDYDWKVCLKCNLTLHRYYSSKPKRQARAEHRRRESRFRQHLHHIVLDQAGHE